jgi:hypothetical protein
VTRILTLLTQGWCLKQQTIGSGVGSVTVTSAFSSTYDNYLIVLSDTVGSTSTSLVCQLGSVTTGYRYSFLYTTYTNTPAAVGTSTATNLHIAGQLQLQVEQPILLCKILFSVKTRFFKVQQQTHLFQATLLECLPLPILLLLLQLLLELEL